MFSISLFLLAAQGNFPPENGNLVPDPQLADYSQGNRAPGITGIPEDVQDADGNPGSL